MTLAGKSGETDAIDYPAEEFRKWLEVNVIGTVL